MSQLSWLAHAWRELGVSERKGRSHNPRVIAMYRDAGHPQIKADEIAWCAAYVGACLERAGVKSTRSLMARSYQKWGTGLSEGQFGAIAVFSRGSNPAHGHVGFWLGETDDKVILLGGNQSDAVTVTTYPKSRLLSLRWPATEAAPAQPNQPQTEGDGFDHALDHVLEMEGGYTDDPHDPGGPTNRGITLGVYAAWKKVQLNTSNRASLIRELKAISSETVKAIYKNRYWTPGHCAEMAAPLAFIHFDASVNHGVFGAMRLLQKALGVTADGEIGPITRGAIARTPVGKLIKTYADVRRARYRALPHFWRFGRGWLRRVDKTLERARALEDAASQVSDPSPKTGAPDVIASDNPSVDKPMTPAIKQDDPKWWGHSMTIWGTLITAASAIIPAIALLYGIDISPDMIKQVGTDVGAVIQAVVAASGTALAIWGRMRAAQPLTRRSINIRL